LQAANGTFFFVQVLIFGSIHREPSGPGFQNDVTIQLLDSLQFCASAAGWNPPIFDGDDPAARTSYSLTDLRCIQSLYYPAEKPADHKPDASGWA
jgi:hypothetical protein